MGFKVVIQAERRTYWLCHSSKGGYAWRQGASGAAAAEVFASQGAAQSALGTLKIKGAALTPAKIVEAE